MAAFAWRRFAALIFVNVLYIVPLLCTPHISPISPLCLLTRPAPPWAGALYAANDKLVGERTAQHGEVLVRVRVRVIYIEG